MQVLQHGNVTYNHHNWGVTRASYKKFPKLANFFKILSVNMDENGKEFISTVEGTDFSRD